MKLITVSGLILAGVVGMTTAQAGISADPGTGILNSKEACASALNNYLSYRRTTGSDDADKVQKLEGQVDALCEGYQIKLVENNGVMTGEIELADD